MGGHKLISILTIQSAAAVRVGQKKINTEEKTISREQVGVWKFHQALLDKSGGLVYMFAYLIVSQRFKMLGEVFMLEENLWLSVILQDDTTGQNAIVSC